jgi:hypothetical protein
MPSITLEQRLAALERRIETLEKTLANGHPNQDWLSTVGTGTWDETAQRIDEAGRRWREAERRKVMRKKPKAQRAK